MSTPDTLKELPEGTFDYAWVLLDRLGNLFGLNERIPVSVQTKLAQSPLEAVRFLIRQTEIERAFRSGNLENLPALAEAIEIEFRAGQQLMRRKAGGQPDPAFSPPVSWQRDSDMSGEKLFSAALICASEHGDILQTTQVWRSHPVAQKWGAGFSTWLDRVGQLISIPTADAAKRLADPEHLSAIDAQILAARVATDDNAAPADTLRSHVQLVLAFAPSFWRPAVGHALANICERLWRRHAERTALLRSPRLTVPPILNACGSSALGVAKAASILLAAAEATGPRVGPEMRARLAALSAYDVPVVQTPSPFSAPPTRA